MKSEKWKVKSEKLKKEKWKVKSEKWKMKNEKKNERINIDGEYFVWHLFDIHFEGSDFNGPKLDYVKIISNNTKVKSNKTQVLSSYTKNYTKIIPKLDCVYWLD